MKYRRGKPETKKWLQTPEGQVWIEEVADSMDMACDRIAVSSGVWKYFCGTCWRKARRSRASS